MATDCAAKGCALYAACLAALVPNCSPDSPGSSREWRRYGEKSLLRTIILRGIGDSCRSIGGWWEFTQVPCKKAHARKKYTPDFTSYDRVIISNVFHDDEGNLQKHPYFHWHLPSVVADTRIQFLNEHIEFVSSNHGKEKVQRAESHVIQLADILVGSISQQLDKSSGKKGKVELGDYMTNILHTAATDSWKAHKNSYDVSFVPNKRLGKRELDKALAQRSSFFKCQPKVDGRLTLL
jgi:hypothetical protein